MTRTTEKTIYQFSELSDEAKDKARDWWRSCDDGEYMDVATEDFAQIAEIIGLDLSTKPVPLMNGKTRQEPEIYYSVSHCQSDYAAFAGTWKYKPGCLKAIKDYAPLDATLHTIVADWCAAQKVNFYRLRAQCSEGRDSQKVNEVCKGYSNRYDEETVNRETEREVEHLVSRLASWLYDRLMGEVDYQNSDEQVDYSIIANEYEFDEEGNIQ